MEDHVCVRGTTERLVARFPLKRLLILFAWLLQCRFPDGLAIDIRGAFAQDDFDLPRLITIELKSKLAALVRKLRNWITQFRIAAIWVATAHRHDRTIVIDKYLFARCGFRELLAEIFEVIDWNAIDLLELVIAQDAGFGRWTIGESFLDD